MTDKTLIHVDSNRVYEDEKGLYFIKRTETFKFLLTNQNGEPVFEKTPCETKEEHITPEELGFKKKETLDIFVYKTEHDDLEDKTVYYSMILTFEVPNEQRYKTAYFYKVKSGKVFLKWFISGTCSEVSINDPEFTKRGKAKKLSDDTILKRGSPIFTLSSNGELERRLSENEVW